MAWKLIYEAPKGLRTNRDFWGVTVFDTDCWFSHDLDKWGEYQELGNGCKSTHDHRPKTTKAFLRYLSKHPELRGKTVTLVNNRYYSLNNQIINLHIDAVWEE